MEALPEESLSLHVTGTNGMLPRKAMRLATLSEIASNTPNVAGVRNLVAPTLPLYPPTGDRFQWRVLSHLAPNFLSLMDAEVLRGTLALYDWTDNELNRRRLEGIRWVSQSLLEEVSGGAVERGVLIEVTLDSHAFSGEGDLMLFGELLHRFFCDVCRDQLVHETGRHQPADANAYYLATQQDISGTAMSPRDFPDLDPMVRALLAHAPQMSFMQMCRLIELRAPAAPGLGTRDTPAHEAVRFRPWPNMGFPSAEVVAVERDEDLPDTPPTVRTTFMGLYGVDAAVPSHMVDDIALREEGHEAVAAFLDQFNHRSATLLYRAWKKYRYPESFRSGGTDEHSRNLLALAGFAEGDKPRRAGLPGVRMLALLGLLIQRTRTAEGLAGVIATGAPGVDVRVEEFFPKRISAGRPRPLGVRPKRAALSGANASKRVGLGFDYVVGSHVVHRCGAVQAVLRPVNAQQVTALLPGAPLHGELMALLKLYMGTKADVYLRMALPSTLAPAPVIGNVANGSAPRLGWTTVLPSREAREIRITLGVHEAVAPPAPNPYLSPKHD